MTATELRLVAHILTLAVLLAAIPAILLVGRRGLSMRYRLILVAALGVYAVWFLLLAISLKDAGFIRRDNTAWWFGGVELTGAVLGWTWLALTARKSFRLVRESKSPPSSGWARHDDGDIWAQAHEIRRKAVLDGDKDALTDAWARAQLHP